MFLILNMAEMFIGHMYAMAGVFIASTALWFGIRAARGTKSIMAEDRSSAESSESYMKDKE